MRTAHGLRGCVDARLPHDLSQMLRCSPRLLNRIVFTLLSPAPRHLRGPGAAPERRTLRFRSGMWNMLHECSEKLLRVPRSLTGAVINFLLPRALESRGAGNAQERRWWRRKRLSVRGSGAVAASGSTAGTARRDGGQDAQEFNGHRARIGHRRNEVRHWTGAGKRSTGVCSEVTRWT